MNIVKNMVKNNGLDKRYLRKHYFKFSASKPLVARSNRVRNAMFLFCLKCPNKDIFFVKCRKKPLDSYVKKCLKNGLGRRKRSKEGCAVDGFRFAILNIVYICEM